MTYHVVLNRPSKLPETNALASVGEMPCHSMATLAKSLDAKIHDGTSLVPNRWDVLIARITRTRPLWWAIARKLRSEIRQGDVIFCTGEDIGVAVATLCGGQGRARVAVMAHYVDRIKGKLAMRVFRLKHRVDLFFGVAQPQVDFLMRAVHGSKCQVRFIWDQTDTHYFHPAAMRASHARPQIISVGLEQRDYSTLAEATSNMNVEVRISGHSADSRALSRAFPAQMPTNMSRRFYSWPDLLSLYQEADIAVISLFPNKHAAGVQALMEALSCGCAVVVTRTEGLAKYLDPKAMMIVDSGDADGMAGAIRELLTHPELRQSLSSAALQLARERFPQEKYVETLASELKALSVS